MAFAPISLSTPQYEDSSGLPANGQVLKAFAAGTSTNIIMATDSSGGTTFTSVALNSLGNPEHLGATIIPHVQQDYKLSLFPTQAAADLNTGAVWTIDNLTPLTITGTFTTNDAVSSGVTNVVSMTHTTSGTPAAGIGTGLEFITEVQNGVNVTGMTLQSKSTDVSSGSEDFDYVINLMVAGTLTEAARVKSTGELTLKTGGFYSINSTSVLNATTLGSAVVTSSLTTVAALNGGSITSGFGNIDNGSSTLDTGVITATSINFGDDALANYDEGTFTPVLTDLTDDATHSVQVGRFTRIGDRILGNLKLTITSLGSVNANIFISGLPFTSANVTNGNHGVSVAIASNLAIGADQTVTGIIASNGTTIQLQLWDDTGGTTAMQATEFSADGTISLSFQYEV